tara:strand:- start:9075 stop:9857 length:783 start_codon:yes stop_codon:yes gene_type:complete
MSNPGNKRRQRAMHGSSPSAVEGETVTTTFRSNGRDYTVSRQTGSVINNGGNMKSGLYPRIGMSLGFLRRTRATEDCGACVANEDVPSITVLARAEAWFGSTAAARVTTTLTPPVVGVITAVNIAGAYTLNGTGTGDTAFTAANTLTGNAAGVLQTAQNDLATATTAADISARKADRDAAVLDYNAKNAVSTGLQTKIDASRVYINSVSTRIFCEIDLGIEQRALAAGTGTAGLVTAAQIALNTAQTAEATALAAWLAAE